MSKGSRKNPVFEWIFIIFCHLTGPWIWTPNGMLDRGHLQWFYTLSIIIPTILSWTLVPEVAITLTILTAIHFALLYLFCIFGQKYNGELKFGTSMFFFIISLLIFVYACTICWSITIATLIFSVVSYVLATILKLQGRSGRGLSILTCWVYFFCLFSAVIILPAVWWVKLLILLTLLLLHPIIDFAAGYELCDIECLLDTTYAGLNKYFRKFK